LVDAYDYLQLLVFGNLLWCIAWLIPIFLMTAVGPQVAGEGPLSQRHGAAAVCIALVVAAFIVGPATMGLAALARAIASRQDPRMADFFQGFRGFYLRGAGLFGLNAVAVTIWATNMFFWSSRGPGGERIGQVGSFVLLTLLSYGMLYWVLMQMYCPALIARENIGMLRATKRSALVVLGNPGYSALAFAQLAAVGALVALPLFVHVSLLMGLSVMLVAFLVVAFAMLVGAEALNDLMRQYEEGTSEDPGSG